jgi:hypothetical protein
MAERHAESIFDTHAVAGRQDARCVHRLDLYDREVQALCRVHATAQRPQGARYVVGDVLAPLGSRRMKMDSRTASARVRNRVAPSEMACGKAAAKVRAADAELYTNFSQPICISIGEGALPKQRLSTLRA